MRNVLLSCSTKYLAYFSCFDRVIITGTLLDIGYAGAMASQLSYHGIKLFDYTRWAEPLREELRNHAEQLAIAAGIEIEFIRRYKAFRKVDRIKAIVAKRADHPGLVHIFSAMESCIAYRPWYDKKKGHASLKPTSGKLSIFTKIDVSIFRLFEGNHRRSAYLVAVHTPLCHFHSPKACPI